MLKIQTLVAFALAGALAACVMTPSDPSPLSSTGLSATTNITVVPAPPPGITGLNDIATYPWNPNRGNNYANPILFADYSDPDVCRVGDDFYMTASSFSCLPGLPILHSKDLINWTLIGHAIQHYYGDILKDPVHGGGVWAPAIRYHNGEFYIFFGDPDSGIFMTKSKDPAGPWEPLHRVAQTSGWIDTCPFWDDDGNAYLVHAFANSRAKVSNILWLNKMAPDGTSLLDDGHLLFDARGTYTTVEGPKMYKRNGFYYVMAPGGGVGGGYEIAFRSKNIDGPYETRIVLDKGKTNINGPHQGGWVDTPDGKQDWFIHFQEVLPYGRITHLQPVQWIDDWPVMGEAAKGDTKGQPALTHRKPALPTQPVALPQTTDEFDAATLGFQWQWWAEWKPEWYSLSAITGSLRLNAVPLDKQRPLYDRANLLLQKFPAEAFTVTAKIDASGLAPGDRGGLVMAGKTTIALQLEKTAEGVRVIRSSYLPLPSGGPPGGPGGGGGRGRGPGRGRGNASQPASQSQPAPQPARGPNRFDEVPYGPIPNISLHPAPTQPARPGPPGPQPRETEGASATVPASTIYLRLIVAPRGYCTLEYSTDNLAFITLGHSITAINDTWIGAKVGLFCNGPISTTTQPAPTPAGHIDIDWFRFE